jgi:PAS domain S-box-containing protein
MKTKKEEFGDAAELNNYEDYYLKLIEEIDDYSIMLLDKRGAVVNCNTCAKKSGGYSAEDMIDKNFEILYPQNDQKNKLPEQLIEEAIKKGKTLQEIRQVKKSGETSLCRIVIHPLYDKSNTINGFLKVTHDHHKRIEQADENSLLNTELVFQNNEKEKRAAELVLANTELAFQNNEKEKRATELVLANTELAFQNNEKEKRAAELVLANTELAFQNAEKEKRAAELVLANTELAFQNSEKEKRAAELVLANAELAFQNNEKEKRAAELVLANKALFLQNEANEKCSKQLMIANKALVLQNKEKEMRAAELIIANTELVFQHAEKEKRSEELIISYKELKNAEQHISKLNIELEQNVLNRTMQLEEANKDLTAFSYSLSHDLRAPLRAINGYAKILQEDYYDRFDEGGKSMLEILYRNAGKMDQLVDDLLAFSKLGVKEVEKSIVYMTGIAKNLAAEVRITKPEVEIKIDNLHTAWGDGFLLKQALLNYLSNAVKYSARVKRPLIEIKSELTDHEIIYSVADNGIGFDMNYADKLFNVFQRLHSSKEFAGSGIGLAIVRRIIRKHGGKTWAKGEPEKGATFYFSLPAISNLSNQA